MPPKQSQTKKLSKPSTSSSTKDSPDKAWIKFRKSLHEEETTTQAMSLHLDEVMGSIMTREEWLKIILDEERQDGALEEFRNMNAPYDKK